MTTKALQVRTGEPPATRDEPKALGGLPELRDRILARTRVVGECWEYIGSRDRRGYGRVSVKVAGRFARRFAHRLVYAAGARGSFHEALVVCHRCDNPPC